MSGRSTERRTDEIIAIDPAVGAQGGRSTRGSPSPSSSSSNFREAGAAAAPPEGDPVEQRPYGEPAKDRGCIWIHLSEVQATAMAGGYVPHSVKSVLRELLDYELEDLKRSARPVPKGKR